MFLYFDNIIEFIIIIFIIIIMLLFFRRFFFIKIRLSFLRLHYLFFLRNYSYVKFFNLICNIDIFIYKKLNSKRYFIYYFFLLKYGFKIYFLSVVIYGFIFNKGVIYIGFLPYYGLYYFFFMLYNYLSNFEADFDRGIVQCYYPEFVTTLSYGKWVLNVYKNKLLFGHSSFELKDYVIYKYDNQFPENWLFFFSWKPWYSGIDIYNLPLNSNIFFQKK